MPGICGSVCWFNHGDTMLSTVSDMASRISFGRSTPNETVDAGDAVFASSSIPDTADHVESARSEDGKLICVVDGFIFPESIGIGEAEPFKPSDTAKLVLHRYISDGQSVLDCLRGQFAIALWDGRDGTLHVVTDFLGIRNLYYAVKDGCLIFSSHMYGFSAVPGFTYSLDDDGLLQYMVFGYCYDDQTLFSTIRLFKPANHYVWRDGKMTAQKYWTTPTAIVTGAKGVKQEDVLYDLFYSSMSRLGRYGQIHGIGLSGGKDSRVVAGMLSRVDGISCYGKTYNISPDELNIATEVARVLKMKHAVINYNESHYEKMMEHCALISEGGINTGEFCLLAMQDAENHDVMHWGWLADTMTGRGLHNQPYLSAKSSDDMYELLYRHHAKGSIPPGDLSQAMPMARKRDLVESTRTLFKKMLGEISVDELYQYAILLTIFHRQRRRTLRVMNVSSHFTPTLYPFAQVEIFSFLLTQPLKQLMAQRLYLKMIVKHFPELAKYRHPQYPFNFKQEYYLSPYVYNLKKVKRFVNKLRPPKTMPGSIDNMYSNYIRTNIDFVRPLVMNLVEGRGLLNAGYIQNMLDEHVVGVRDSYSLILKLMTLEQFLRYTVDGEILKDPALETVHID